MSNGHRVPSTAPLNHEKPPNVDSVDRWDERDGAVGSTRHPETFPTASEELSSRNTATVTLTSAAAASARLCAPHLFVVVLFAALSACTYSFTKTS